MRQNSAIKNIKINYHNSKKCRKRILQKIVRKSKTKRQRNMEYLKCNYK